MLISCVKSIPGSHNLVGEAVACDASIPYESQFLAQLYHLLARRLEKAEKDGTSL